MKARSRISIMAVAAIVLMFSACSTPASTLAPKPSPTKSLTATVAPTIVVLTPTTPLTNATGITDTEIVPTSAGATMVQTDIPLASLIAELEATLPTPEETQEIAVTQPATLKECATGGMLTVGTDATYPPFESVNERTGYIEGFDKDLLTAIGQKEGFMLNIHNALGDTIFTALSYGQYDAVISAATITADRQQTVNFSNPYFIVGPVIIVRKTDINEVKSPDDLAGKIVGVQSGTTSVEVVKGIKNIKNVKEYQTVPEAFQELANGNVDVVVNDNVASLSILLNMPTLNLVVTGAPITRDYYGIAVRKDCTGLLKKINDGLAAVISDGTYASLYAKYFGVEAADPFKQGDTGMLQSSS